MSEKKKRNRSIVWDHFSPCDANKKEETICNHCGHVMKKGCTSNLLKHLERKHSNVVTKSSFDQDTYPSSCQIDTGTDSDAVVFEVVAEGNEGETGNKEVLSSRIEVINKNPKKKKRVPSVVWNFFNYGDSIDHVICSICGAAMTKTSGTTNLLKHLKVKHPAELEGNVELKSPSSNQDEEMNVAIANMEHSILLGGTPEKPKPKFVVHDRSRALTKKATRIKKAVKKKSRSKSIAWKYFKLSASNENYVICRICGILLKVCGGTSTMLKHIHTKHTAHLKAHYPSSSPSLTKVDQNLSEDMVLLEMSTETDMEHISIDSGIIQKASGRGKNKGKYKKGEMINNRMKSGIWRYFVKTMDKTLVICKICGNQLKIPSVGTTSNMWKHVHRNHPDAIFQEEKKPPSSHDFQEMITYTIAEPNAPLEDVQASNIKTLDDHQANNVNVSVLHVKDPEEITVEELSEEELMKKRRSAVWRHFKEEAGNKVSCRHCNKILTNHGNTSIMLRHLRSKHPDLVGCLLDTDAPTVPIEWPDDQVQDDSEAVAENSSVAQKKRSAVWRHFQEEDNDKVSCRICNEKLAKHGNTSSMLRHLRTKHPSLKLPGESPKKSNQFHLKSNVTENRFLTVCNRLLLGNQLTDCTLLVDGQFIQAHRLVLAASSPHFEEIFKMVTQQNPVVVLSGISRGDMKALLHYMYKGEALVKSNELPSLLKAAAQLKIKGLSEVGLSESWVEQDVANGAAYYTQEEHELADMDDGMEMHMVQPSTSYKQGQLDLMSMCEDVNLSGESPVKGGGQQGSRILKGVQIKVEHGGIPGLTTHTDDQQHTATHYISSGEEVVLHQEAHHAMHHQQGDDGSDMHHAMEEGELEATGSASMPIIDDGSHGQSTAQHHTTIDDEGLILLGLAGGPSHTAVFSSGTTTAPAQTSSQRPTIPGQTRKYTKRDLTQALKLVEEGHLGIKPAARAFNIPVGTLYTYAKRKETEASMKETM